MDYECSVCGRHFKDDLLVYMDHTKQHIIEEIQTDHPDWVEEDGVCRKCAEYYRRQLRGESSPEGR